MRQGRRHWHIAAATVLATLIVSMIASAATSTTASAAPADSVAFNFTPNSVLAASQLAHDYFVTANPNPGDTNWVYSAYHVGEFERYKRTGDPASLDHTVAWADANAYRPFTLGGGDPCPTTYADGQSGGQVLFELAQITQPPPSTLDCFRQSVLGTVNSPKKNHWYWVDALYMAPTSWATMAEYAATPDERAAIYEAIYAEFSFTRDQLFNTDYHLFARDGRYVYPKITSPDGSPMFWSRGNGWAFAGLARLLDRLPPDAPHYNEYLDTYLKMAAALQPLQQANGFWGSDLLEPYHINQPETSGTAFFVYGMAIGVRKNFLDRASYLPTIERGWLGLANTALQTSGLLGWTQPSASSPGPAKPNSTQPYGVGTFLAASAEIYGLLANPNVSQGKPVACSAEPQPDQAPCRQAVDGDVNRRWSSNVKPSSIEIDLGAITDLSAFRATFYYHRDYRYTVDVKLGTGDQYRTVIDNSGNTEGRPELLAFPDHTAARFVRVTVNGAATYRGGWVSIGELEVFGQPSTLQRLTPATPPVCTSEPQAHFPCRAAIDGGLGNGSRWSAMTFPQSIEVDLGSPQVISAVAVHALYNRSYDYQLAVRVGADDEYQTVAEFNAGNGSGTAQPIAPVTAQWARLTVTGIADGSTNWVSIREWELFGEG